MFEQVCNEIKGQYLIIADLEGLDYKEVIKMMGNLSRLDPTIIDKLEAGLIKHNSEYKEYAREALKYVLEI
jgi:hypothetical protein